MRFTVVRWRRLPAWACLSLALVFAGRSQAAEPSNWRTRVRTAWRGLKQLTGKDYWKSRCRSCAQKWAKHHAQPSYGLFLPRGAVHQDHLVVFVHGYNSRPEDLEVLVTEAHGLGHCCALFRYPNDQPLHQSARLLATELSDMRRANPLQRISIVAHSMGGLVARAVIEDPALDTQNVCQLIMLSPPNHGAEIARCAHWMDAYEYLASRDRRREAGPFVGSVLDGLSEAADDLQPNSPFLRQLNDRSRNARVQYTIVMGTDAPLSGSQCEYLQRHLHEMADRCPWGNWWLAAPIRESRQWDALVNGKGDGVITTQSARLAGVTDFVQGTFDHTGLLAADADTEVKAVRHQILNRLAAAPAAD